MKRFVGLSLLIAIALLAGAILWSRHSHEPPLTCPPGLHVGTWEFNGQHGQGCMK